MIYLKEALSAANQQYQGPDSRIDIECLMCFVLKKSRAYLYAHDDYVLSDQEYQNFQRLLQERIDGHPIAYLTGEKEFWSLKLHVNTTTLIPRPETELLIETILELFPLNRQLKVLDLGTGSGAIALALASERPNWHIDAVDNSEHAINMAKSNSIELNIRNVHFYKSNWYQSLPESKYDIIVSNPPYLATDDPHLNEGDLRYEPKSALISGNNGLDDIQHIINESNQWLTDSGVLLIEHGYQQHEIIEEIFKQHSYTNIMQKYDLQGHTRITMATKNDVSY